MMMLLRCWTGLVMGRLLRPQIKVWFLFFCFLFFALRALGFFDPGAFFIFGFDFLLLIFCLFWFCLGSFVFSCFFLPRCAVGPRRWPFLVFFLVYLRCP